MVTLVTTGALAAAGSSQQTGSAPAAKRQAVQASPVLEALAAASGGSSMEDASGSGAQQVPARRPVPVQSHAAGEPVSAPSPSAAIAAAYVADPEDNDYGLSRKAYKHWKRQELIEGNRLRVRALLANTTRCTHSCQRASVQITLNY